MVNLRGINRGLMRRTSSHIGRVFIKMRNAIKPFYRTQYAVLALAILAPTFSTLYLELHNSKLYKISDSEKSLISATSVKKELIKTTEDAYTYNRKEELKGLPNGSDPKLQELLLSANKTDSTGKEPYQASLSKDPTKGLTFGDAEGNRQFTLTPNFGLSEAKLDDESRVVYPVSTTERSIYTFKKNGIKNDITLLEAPSADPNTNGSIKTYKYTLDLGKELDAKQLPSGDVGIYSADPKFFGNVQTSDENSKALVEKARANSPKDTLVFEIPKPFIIDSSKKINYEDVSFKLEPNKRDQTKPTLILEVRNLQNLPYPLSIDPTITVTTTSDFQTNTGDTGNVDFSTSGQITRGSIGSGAVGAEGASSTFTTARLLHTSVVYNGYLYVIGGSGVLYLSDIQYCPINANGTVGTCTTNATGFTTARGGHSSVVNNGYLYIIGGSDGTLQNDIQYCPINANGSVGACTQQTNAFTTARMYHSSAIRNGYLYIVGGASAGGYFNDIQYCPINANGSVGACTQQTNAFTTARGRFGFSLYNGYIYIVGGISATSGLNGTNDIQYCPINANGSVGACTQQTSAFTSTRYGLTSNIKNGYLYIVGGLSQSTYLNDIQYCPINANGSVGACTQQTSAFTNIRFSHTSVLYGDSIYVIGGANTGNLNDIRNVPITSAGRAGPTTQQNSAFTSGRGYHGTAFYMNYIYITGGRTDALGTSVLSDIIYCQISGPAINSPCTTNSTGFTTARSQHATIIANGYLYIIGGLSSTSVLTDIQYCAITGPAVSACSSLPSNNLPSARSAHSAYSYNGYLYVVGGTDGSNSQNTIMYAQLNTNGTLGAWVTVANAFSGARANHTTVISNGYLYIIGGQVASLGSQNDIISCVIQSNGGVGACVQQNNIFTTARNSHASVVYNGYLFIIGGGVGSNAQNDIQYCQIDSSTGVIQSCVQKSNAYTTARNGLRAEIYNGYLYLIGGQYTDVLFTTTNYNDIQYLRIGPPDNTPATTSTNQASAFTNGRSDHASVVYNGFLYIIAGGSYESDIQYCPINPNGTIGSCTRQNNLFTGRAQHWAVVYNGFIYVIGGISSGGARLNDIVTCTINASNGSISGCVTKSNAFTDARNVFQAVAYNGFIYIVGGAGAGATRLGDITYCPVSVYGNVGDCVRQANAFTNARYDHSVTAYNGYLYIVGGNGTSGFVTDIQYCPINSNGSTGTCIWQNANAFQVARAGFTAQAYNGYLYIMGGGYADLQYCPINPNGAVSPCTRTDNVFISTIDNTTAIYNGWLYMIGGSNSANIQRVSLSTISPSASYERTIDTTSSTNTIGSFVILGSELCGYSVKYQTAGSTNIYGAVTTVPFVRAGSNIPVTATNTRYLRIGITLDDSTCGSTSTITDIIVYYNDTPNAPTLLLPANNATSVNVLPEFRLGSSDENSYQRYFRYKIDVCSTSNCSSIVRTIDQTASQTGWIGQSQLNGTAYGAGGSIVEYAIHQYQTAALSANTQYWWRGYAIDPEGSNTWSSASAISTFTTGSATPSSVNITSGTNITSGSKISP